MGMRHKKAIDSGSRTPLVAFVGIVLRQHGCIHCRKRLAMVSIAHSTQDVGLGLGRRVHGLVKDVVKRVGVDPSVSVQFDVPIVFDRLPGQVAIDEPHRLQQVGVEMQGPLWLVVGFDGNNGGVVE